MALALSASPALLQAQEAAPAQEAPAGLPYTVSLTGVEDEDLAETLRRTSSLFTLRDDPPPSLFGLERRAAADRDRLQRALRSAGFYDATLDIRIDAEARPAAVTVAVTPGPVYRFAEVEATAPGGEPLPLPVGGLGLAAGEPARAQAVVGAQQALLRRLREQGYAFAEVLDRRAVVDHEARAMDVTWVVDPGPLVRLGEVVVEGEERAGESLIRGRIPWEPGRGSGIPRPCSTARGPRSPSWTCSRRSGWSWPTSPAPTA